MKRIIECIPNFSEGRNPAVIEAIAEAIRSVSAVKLLDVDPGASTNRTVMTLAGSPEAVIEAAYRGIKRASELIDMRQHKGAHPRMGATDVCPLVPISGVTVEECVAYAKQLAERVGRELQIPVYLYEYAASSPQRRSLADIRAGEYEGFAKKILLPEWKPDYGPAAFNPIAGQTVIGVREMLIAYNVNLNTTSVRKANSVAFDVREAGRVVTENGKTKLDDQGKPVRVPGKLKHVRAIGWYIDEFGIAQVSINLTNIRETPLHQVFAAVEESAMARGMRVTGSELVGLIPLSALVDAGKYFLQRQGRSLGVSERELIDIAVKSLGLSELRPFEPEKKVIEYLLAEGSHSLMELSARRFAEAVASESPAPGGGTVSALIGALGAALGTMVANLSCNRAEWEHKLPVMSPIAETLQGVQARLLLLADVDSQAFNQVMAAFGMPKATTEEKAARSAAIEAATLAAAEVPLEVMQQGMMLYPHLLQLAREGNSNALSDAGVGALCAHTCIHGAGLNVRINLAGLKDANNKARLSGEATKLIAESAQRSAEIIALVEAAIAKG